MNRSDSQKLAVLRLGEARILLQHGKYHGAYYLADYAVECALKACLAKRTKKFDFPLEPSVVRDCYTHSFKELLKVAELTSQKESDNKANPRLEANWAIANQWKETRRYGLSTKREATDLLDAIADEPDGVLPWIKRHW
jgi:HEPN domain-containing protein